MDRIVVQGGKRLQGEIKVSGSKNAALPQMAACMLAPGKSTLRNIAYLRNIETMADMLNFVGCATKREDDRLTIDSASFNLAEAPYDMVRKMRASIYVMGPMLARLKKAKVSLPGGCAIGARPIDLHLKGFEAMGAKITLEGGYVHADGENMKGAELSLEGEFGSSVGATCNILMAAVLTPGRTVIHGAAREPEVAELARMLNLMGARITGIDSATMEIEGVEQLRPVTYATIPDRIEAGTYMIAGAITGGEVLVTGARADHMNAVLDKLLQIGVEVEILPDGVRVRANAPLRPTTIQTLPFPGFPTDMQAQFMALLCLAEGESVLREGIYPDRFIHAAELMRMGAEIQIGRGEARVKGGKKLSAAPLMASDLRASAALVVAGLAAEGDTEINRVYHIDRGYERIEEKLASLGASIRRETNRKTPTEADIQEMARN
ncbi:UDP-N-acetylglucosamine 1-carboxyvinyltransferase [Candidatus Sumerlaeota bacterium]|nr:UDP-N-acetylglucosamine 1-carboxyvinyltransferase [Candidatus Sumerlaeota bacterium]